MVVHIHVFMNMAVLHDEVIRPFNVYHIQCISGNQVWHYSSMAVHHLQVHLNDHGLANIHIMAIRHYVFLWKYIKWTRHNGVMVQK